MWAATAIFVAFAVLVIVVGLKDNDDPYGSKEYLDSIIQQIGKDD